MKYMFLTLYLILPVLALSQIPVTDHSNRGQYKRMTSTQWNDWRPDPTTILGIIPKNPVGYAYWRILHNAYYTGSDKRPYKTNGQFDQNMALLAIQYQKDQMVEDSLKQIYLDNISTYVNMLGGEGDISYNMYYKKIFDKLKNEVMDLCKQSLKKYPTAVHTFLNAKYTAQYFEYLFNTADRISTTHQEFMDKGDRMVTYAKIENELTKRNKEAKELLIYYVQSEKKLGNFKARPANPGYVAPTPVELPHKTDSKIVAEILANITF